MVNLPDSIIADNQLRKLIIAGVILVIGGCIITQVFVQFAGGIRNERLDLSDQIPAQSEDSIHEVGVFPDGLPAFISSGGVYQPEKTIFNISLTIGGLLFAILAIEQYLRIRSRNNWIISQQTGSAYDKSGEQEKGVESDHSDSTGLNGVHWFRRASNFVQLISGVVLGLSLVLLTRFPMNEDMITHILVASLIFQSIIVYTAAMAAARGQIDHGVRWRDWSVTKIRWVMFGCALISYQAMLFFITTGQLTLSALFEWTLTFSIQGTVLTLLLTLNSGRASTASSSIINGISNEQYSPVSDAAIPK
jgi:hypothetical protein